MKFNIVMIQWISKLNKMYFSQANKETFSQIYWDIYIYIPVSYRDNGGKSKFWRGT